MWSENKEDNEAVAGAGSELCTVLTLHLWEKTDHEPKEEEEEERKKVNKTIVFQSTTYLNNPWKS